MLEKYCDFRDREICFFDSDKIGFPLRGYRAEYQSFIDEISKYESDFLRHRYNSYCSICQYEPMPMFPLHDNKERWKQFKQWVSIRDLSIVKVDFFVDFDGKSLKEAFTDCFNAKQYLFDLIGKDALYLNIYFSGNKGFHLLGKMGESFGVTPAAKLKKNFELAMMLKPLCPSIDETIYDLARVRKLIGSKVHSPTLGQTRVISVDSWEEFNQLDELIAKKDWSAWEKMPIKRLNKIEMGART
jgi:hypothetical protein